MGQDRGTLSRFVEVCGDKLPADCTRADLTGLLDTLRRLPNSYGRSPRDKDRSAAEIIAGVDAKGVEWLADKTFKRHLSALAQSFRFVVDGGHLTNNDCGELVDGHRFRETRAAKDQRDIWTVGDLKRLLTSPMWAGCEGPGRRSASGAAIIRLALFHEARLKEFADPCRHDLGHEDGLRFLRIQETEGRTLRTDNAARVLPISPEVMRLGFIDCVYCTEP